jgi:hypothetical protein
MVENGLGSIVGKEVQEAIADASGHVELSGQCQAPETHGGEAVRGGGRCGKNGRLWCPSPATGFDAGTSLTLFAGLPSHPQHTKIAQKERTEEHTATAQQIAPEKKR